MRSVCFILDALVTGAQLPRHLVSIRSPQAEMADAPVVITTLQPDLRLMRLQKRYHSQSLVTPTLSLGARLNYAVDRLNAEWVIIALQKSPIPPEAWVALHAKLNVYLIDAVLIGLPTPALPKRLLQRFVAAVQAHPPYLAIRRGWLEQLGGFDPELDDEAIRDIIHRLNVCPTRWDAISFRHINATSQSPPFHAQENVAPSKPAKS
ncbi:hypothetical protein GLV89_03760 [Halomonas alkaliantarctica]|nr:hypothetical protein [Halomonas alkaliantarctica]